MERKNLNPVLKQLRVMLEEKVEGEISIKLLEILEMLMDRREEDDLLIKQRLEEIISTT